MTDWLLVVKSIEEAVPWIFSDPFGATTHLFVAKPFDADTSIITISSPTAPAGKVIVTILATVSTPIWSPGTAVYVVLLAAVTVVNPLSSFPTDFAGTLPLD